MIAASKRPLDRRFSVAPMMDWTDRHCRAFHRLLTRRALLYTEMVTADAVIHGDRARLLGWDPEAEGPVALQIGGSEPSKLAAAARAGADFGYSEINLNVGCPSDRVQSGAFGACLMREPALVAEGCAAMIAAVDVPVTVKCRIGVDDQDPREALFTLVEACAAAGVRAFIVHARKAWLKGLSPKENRDVPPLDYALVRELKGSFPDLEIILNGGLEDADHAARATAGLDGAMLGRAAYQRPAVLCDVDDRFYNETNREATDLAAVVDAMAAHAGRHAARGGKLHDVTRHMLGLLHGRPGARLFRRILSEEGVKPGAGPSTLIRAYESAAGGRRAGGLAAASLAA